MSLTENPKRVSDDDDGIIIEKQSGETLILHVDDWIEFQTWKGDFQVGKIEGFQANAFVFVKTWNTYTNMFNNTEAQIALHTNIPKYNADGFWTTISLLPPTTSEQTITAFLKTRQDEKDRSIHKTKLTAVHQEYDTLPENVVPGYPGGKDYQSAKKEFEQLSRTRKGGKKSKRKHTQKTNKNKKVKKVRTNGKPILRPFV
jgi:hypothetical protein